VHLRRTFLLCVLAAACSPRLAGADVAVRLTGDVRFHDGAPVLELVANGNGEAAEVTPTVVYQHRTWTGDTATIPPGSRHAWSFPLPVPDDPGTFPVSIRADYRAGGRTAMTPLVLVLATPGAAGSPVRMALTTTPITTFGRGELVLENGDDRTLAGRVSYLLPSGLRTDPESTPALLAAGERAVLPLLIENLGAPPTSGESLFAVFEYGADGSHHTVIATAPLTVASRGGLSVALMVGLGALAAAVCVLAVAWRRAAAA
jgi:hypothetical protein